MSEILVPVYEQYTMTIKEASCYFPNAPWYLMNGNRIQIKRKQFEKFIDELDVI